jgi:hypothetical protein
MRQAMGPFGSRPAGVARPTFRIPEAENGHYT